MLPNVTAAVSRALDLARALAGQQGRRSALLPVHLLHGLLAEEEGSAGTLAARGGLDWDAYRLAAPPRQIESPGEIAVQFDPLAGDALYLARELALTLAGESEVSG